MRELHIGGRRIADDTGTYLIADIGHDPWDDLERAEVLFLQAAMAGAQAIALTAPSLAELIRYEQPDGGPYGRRETRRGLRQFGRAEYARVAEIAADIGLDLVPTAADKAGVDFLRDLGDRVCAVRIEPDDLTNLPLLAATAELGRPVLLGVRAATAEQIAQAVQALPAIDLALVQHAMPRPRTAEDLNLGGLVTLLADHPRLVIGFAGAGVCPEQSWIASAVGARIIETRIPPDRETVATMRRLTLDPLGLVRYDGTTRWGGNTRTVQAPGGGRN
jgi:sialic acid synthase